MTELLDLPLDGRLVAVVAAVLLGGFLRGFVGFGAALVTRMATPTGVAANTAPATGKTTWRSA